jgi:serine/threonine-protein kinase
MRGRPADKRLLAAVAVVVLAAVAYFVLKPSGGGVVITVAGPGGRTIENIEIFVDGQKRCDVSPCRVESLEEGPHLVRASANGYETTADQAVAVEAARTATLNVSLTKSSETGLRVSARGVGLKLWVDGKEAGPLPQSVTDLSPGQHTIRVGGNPRYEDLEQQVLVDSDSMKSIGPLELKVLKGLATLEPGVGADGATVLLGGRRVPSLPATIEVPAGQTLELVATKDGYVTFRRKVLFDDGDAEKTFEITMVEGMSTPPPVAPRTPLQGGGSPPARQAPPPPVAAPAAKGTVNLTSNPVSNVILNGRPLGPTPKMGVSTDPGPVTVVFVHPEHGRKVLSGSVGPGESKTFVAKFP